MSARGVLIEDSFFSGISLFYSTVRIGGLSGGIRSVIQDNGFGLPTVGGIFGRSGTLTVGSTDILDNAGAGLWLQDNSVAHLGGTTVMGNGEGAVVESGSGMRLGGNVRIMANASNSLVCFDNFSWVTGNVDLVDKPIQCKVLKPKTIIP